MRGGPLGGGFGGNGAAVGRVKRWVEEIRCVAEAESVLVAELRCSEPGCPPVETSISVLGGEGTRQSKVHKPVAEVTREDVVRLVISDSELSVGDGREG